MSNVLHVTIQRTADGTVRVYDFTYDGMPGWEPPEDGLSGSAYSWEEGNYACDCNRAMFFAYAGKEKPEEDPPCGHDRFTILKITQNDDPTTLYEEDPPMTTCPACDSEQFNRTTLAGDIDPQGTFARCKDCRAVWALPAEAPPLPLDAPPVAPLPPSLEKAAAPPPVIDEAAELAQMEADLCEAVIALTNAMTSGLVTFVGLSTKDGPQAELIFQHAGKPAPVSYRGADLVQAIVNAGGEIHDQLVMLHGKTGKLTAYVNWCQVRRKLRTGTPRILRPSGN